MIGGSIRVAGDLGGWSLLPPGLPGCPRGLLLVVGGQRVGEVRCGVFRALVDGFFGPAHWIRCRQIASAAPARRRQNERRWRARTNPRSTHGRGGPPCTTRGPGTTPTPPPSTPCASPAPRTAGRHRPPPRHHSDPRRLVLVAAGQPSAAHPAQKWPVIAGVPVAVAGLTFLLGHDAALCPDPVGTRHGSAPAHRGGRRRGDGAVARLCGDLQGGRHLPVVHRRPRRHPAAAGHHLVVAG